ncbi:MAG: hypothetical protein JW850_08570 [Thermoflexales bacterium]|nr:hypothetical protein [Thermoflexales bacterium]
MEAESQQWKTIDSEPESDRPEAGQLIRLDVSLRSGGLWIGPAWAVVCGIVASGRFAWDARGLLLAGLALFLVDGVWATLWASVVETDWAGLAAGWDSSPPPLRARRLLPYVQAGAPGDRAAGWLAHLARWWQNRAQPMAGTAVSSIAVCLPLGAALSALLGWQMLALSAAALAMVQLGLVANRASGRPVPLLQAGLEFGLAWLAGQAAFGPVTLPSALMALLFATAYYGGLRLVEQGAGLANWRWPQLIVALVLLVLRQPLPALALFFILFAQVLLEPALGRGRSGAWFVRSSQAWLMAAMLVVAFTIR